MDAIFFLIASPLLNLNAMQKSPDVGISENFVDYSALFSMGIDFMLQASSKKTFWPPIFVEGGI